MSKQKELMKCLDQLNNINNALYDMSETLKENSYAIHQVMHDLLEEESEGFHESSNEDTSEEVKVPFEEYFKEKDVSLVQGEETDDLESLSNKIIKGIKEQGENGIQGVSIVFDPDKIDPYKLMKLVEDKMEKGYEPPKKEEFDDDINFDNPL